MEDANEDLVTALFYAVLIVPLLLAVLGIVYWRASYEWRERISRFIEKWTTLGFVAGLIGSWVLYAAGLTFVAAVAFTIALVCAMFMPW